MNEFTRNCLHERFQGNELYHHGVLGMHWGIRRYQPYGHGGYKPDHKGKFEGTKKEAREHAKEIKQDLKEAKRIDRQQRKFVKKLNSKNGIQKLAKDKNFQKLVKENNTKAMRGAILRRRLGAEANQYAVNKMLDKHFGYDDSIDKVFKVAYKVDNADDLFVESVKFMNKADVDLGKEILGKYADTPINKIKVKGVTSGASADSYLYDVIREAVGASNGIKKPSIKDKINKALWT